MLEYIYPSEERFLFTDREHFLALLDLSRDLLTQGIRKHIAISGFRRIGKSIIMKEFLRRSLEKNSTENDVIIAYLDIPRLSRTPETFAMQYLGYLMYWLTDGGDGHADRYFSAGVQSAAAGKLGLDELAEHIDSFHQEASKLNVDQHLLLEKAFNLPEVYAKAGGKKAIVLIDEFPDIEMLNSYPQVGDILALFRSVLQTQSNVTYVVAGSMISLMEQIFLDAESPLFVHFQLESVGPFGKENCAALANKLLEPFATAPPNVLSTLYQVTNGHPFYTYAICMRVIESIALGQKALSPETIHEAFTLETLERNGRIYNLCRYILEHSLQDVRGENMPQAVLQTLAEEPGGLILSEIANRLRRREGAIHQVLGWLIDVDLIEKDENKIYHYRDAVLQIWVAYYYSGLTLTSNPSQKVLSNLVAELIERYEKISAELGVAKESQIREMLQDFDGQIVNGDLLGLSGEFQLPTFNSVAPYISPDGQIEIDALAKGNELWVIEVKWRGRRCGENEIKSLDKKTKLLSSEGEQFRAWFISKSGFTTAAIRAARKSNMMISEGKGITQLIKEIEK